MAKKGQEPEQILRVYRVLYQGEFDSPERSGVTIEGRSEVAFTSTPYFGIAWAVKV
jgi:hypothetical protein